MGSSLMFRSSSTGSNDCQEWTTTPVVGLPWPDAYVYSAIEAEKNGIGYMLLQRSPIGGLARLIAAGLGLDHRNDIQHPPSEVQAFILKRWLVEEEGDRGPEQRVWSESRIHLATCRSLQARSGV